MSRLTAILPAIAATATDTTVTCVGDIEVTDGGYHITEAVLVAPAGAAAITSSATDHTTFTVRLLRAGAVVDPAVALLDTASVPVLAETPAKMVLGSQVNLTGAGAPSAGLGTEPSVLSGERFSTDDVLDVVVHQIGAGRAVVAGTVVQIDLA